MTVHSAVLLHCCGWVVGEGVHCRGWVVGEGVHCPGWVGEGVHCRVWVVGEGLHCPGWVGEGLHYCATALLRLGGRECALSPHCTAAASLHNPHRHTAHPIESDIIIIIVVIIIIIIIITIIIIFLRFQV